MTARKTVRFKRGKNVKGEKNTPGKASKKREIGWIIFKYTIRNLNKGESGLPFVDQLLSLFFNVLLVLLGLL